MVDDYGYVIEVVLVILVFVEYIDKIFKLIVIGRCNFVLW